MEAVVYDSKQQNQDSDTDTFAAAKAHDLMIQQVFGNPAYPASHPANQHGNLAEFGLLSSKEDLKKLPQPQMQPRPAKESRWRQPRAQEWQQHVLGKNSPTALSSKSSNSFTSELIAQKFGLDANDPMFKEDTKGDLISLFFS
jgi:hypothetical protein